MFNDVSVVTRCHLSVNGRKPPSWWVLRGWHWLYLHQGTLDWCTTCEEEKRRGAERSCPDFKVSRAGNLKRAKSELSALSLSLSLSGRLQARQGLGTGLEPRAVEKRIRNCTFWKLKPFSKSFLMGIFMHFTPTYDNKNCALYIIINNNNNFHFNLKPTEVVDLLD